MAKNSNFATLHYTKLITLSLKERMNTTVLIYGDYTRHIRMTKSWSVANRVEAKII